MKKKPLIYYQIKKIVLFAIFIFCFGLFIISTFNYLQKKYILRKDGITVNGVLYHREKVRKIRITYYNFYYRFEFQGKVFNLKSRQYPTSKSDSVEIVILPDDPNCNAIKRWVEQSWIVPPYWQ